MLTDGIPRSVRTLIDASVTLSLGERVESRSRLPSGIAQVRLPSRVENAAAMALCLFIVLSLMDDDWEATYPDGL